MEVQHVNDEDKPDDEGEVRPHVLSASEGVSTTIEMVMMSWAPNETGTEVKLD